MEVLSFLSQFGFIIVLVSFCLVAYILKGNAARNKNLPPGPRGWPIVGYWPHLGHEPHVMFTKLGQTYGRIFTVPIGDNNVVVFNDVESIREAFVKKAHIFADRPTTFYNTNFIFGHSGLFVISASSFIEERRLITSTLKDFGVGKSFIESMVYDEVAFALNRIRSLEGKPFNPISLFGCIFGNTIIKYLADKHYDYDDARFLKILTASQSYDEIAGRFSALDFMPWLRFLPERLNGFAEPRKVKELFQPFFEELLLEHAKTFDETNIRDFLDVSLQKLSSEERQRLIDFRDDDENFRMIRGNTLILFVGGASVGSGVLSILFKMLTVCEDVQERVQKEVDRVVGSDRSPSYADRLNMPYTEATVLEALRYSNLVPVGSFRSNAEQVRILGYDIPKNSVVYGNYGKVLNDPQHWKNPNEFCPSNFLDDNGKVFRPEWFWPFSAGKRQCPGKNFAEIQMFFILVTFLQRFQIHSPIEAKPYVEFVSGSLRYPKAFQLFATTRY